MEDQYGTNTLVAISLLHNRCPISDAVSILNRNRPCIGEGIGTFTPHHIDHLWAHIHLQYPQWEAFVLGWDDDDPRIARGVQRLGEGCLHDKILYWEETNYDRLMLTWLHIVDLDQFWTDERRDMARRGELEVVIVVLPNEDGEFESDPELMDGEEYVAGRARARRNEVTGNWYRPSVREVRDEGYIERRGEALPEGCAYTVLGPEDRTHTAPNASAEDNNAGIDQVMERGEYCEE